MKKLSLLSTAAVVLVALSAPSFAASPTHRGDTAQSADQFDPVRRNYYETYSNPGYNAFARGEDRTYQSAPQQAYPTGGNLPYPDRPWGDPDRW
jgi:hypothetical protein